MNLRQLLERGNRPFPPQPQVGRYFPAASIEAARGRLARTIERGDGPGLVIGSAGTGKSLLLQVLAAQFRERFDVVLLACAQVCTRRALLQAIHFELGLDYHRRDEGQLRLSLLDQLLSAGEAVEGLLLLVDEAQLLATPLLEELRVLTNLACNGLPRVRLVLAGLPSLEEKLASPELESFSQRLAARCYVSPLTREETGQYVRAQVAASGANAEQLFARSAWDPLFNATDGVPRLVNQVCDRALLIAESKQLGQIDEAVIQAAWADLQQLPTPWEPPQKTDERPSSAAGVVEFGSLEETHVGPPVNKAPSPCPLPEGEGSPRAASSFTPISDWDARQPDDDDVDPTDLGDELAESTRPVEPTAIAEVPPRPAASYRRRIAGAPVPEAADPFADDFDEEEIVLDSFAALAGVFRKETPRVENRRDPAFSRLVQRALDSSTMVATREPARDELSQAVDENSCDPDRPQIRIAAGTDSEPLPAKRDVRAPSREAAAALAELDRLIAAQDEARANLQRSASPAWSVTRTLEALAPTGVSTAIEIEPMAEADEVPAEHVELAESILVIEDDPATAAHVEPGVRREEYRQLFSRLRHG